MCQHGHRVVRDVFESNKSDKLKGYIVFLPIIRSDKEDSAETEAAAMRSDTRINVCWNADKSIGEAFKKTLKIRCTAWDVYLVYGPGKIWDQEIPPLPDFWMHQLDKRSGADGSKRLNQQVLKQNIINIIEHRATADPMPMRFTDIELLRSLIVEKGSDIQNI